MYSSYKPMRNFAAKLNLIGSLVQIWTFFGNIHENKPLPPKFASLNKSGKASLKDVVHPWELDILTREIVLNAGSSAPASKDLYKTNDLAAAINNIRKLIDRQNHTDLDKTIHQEIQRLYQQQSLWHTNVNLMMARHLKIYSTPGIASVLIKGTSISVEQFYILGIAIAGHFMSNHVYNMKQSYAEFGISNEQRDAFLEKVVISFDDLKARTISMQEYNENWSYTINPLLSTPLIAIDPTAPHLAVCPIPFFLKYRISEGLFFDIAKIKGYEQSYGDAFEQYVQDVSNTLNSGCGSSVVILKPAPYKVGNNRKDGVDLIVYDASGAILVECKAKRLNLRARYQLDSQALYDEIEILAKYVVQNYKNLQDIVNAHTGWQPGDRTLSPIVVTLISWNLFGPRAYEKLEESVLRLLQIAGISTEIVQTHPYNVMSVEEYETAFQIIKKVGVKEFFQRRAEHQKGWLGYAIY